MTTRLLTPVDVAARLQCSEKKARRVMRSLPHVRVGGRLRVKEESLVGWIDRGGNVYAGAPWAQGTKGFSSAGASGGAGVTTPEASAGKKRRASGTTPRPNSRHARSPDEMLVSQISARLARKLGSRSNAA